MTNSRLAQAATWYASKGWSVFPLIPKDKKPLAQHGVRDASTDPIKLKTWWDAEPNANIGIATGEQSGVFAVDVDGADGAATLADLELIHGPLPPTVEAITARGRHLLFKVPVDAEIRNSAGKLGPGLDVRGTGGYIAVAPSIHPSGAQYAWKNGHQPSRIEPAEPPSWLVDRLTRLKEQAVNGHTQPLSPDPRLHNYAATALARELAAMASAPEGQRNHQLNRSGFSLGQLIGAGLINRQRVEHGLFGAAAAAGLDAKEAARTIASGIEGGLKHPREIPEPARAAAAPSSDRIAEPPRTQASWPELEAAALHGSAGDVVRTIDPHTEADQAAILVQLLIAFGNAVGRGPYFSAEADRHGTNLFAVFVGETAKGRKGTSWSQARRVMALADETWPDRIVSGLSSGEGLIWHVRDPVERREPVKEKGRITGYNMVIADDGVPDKRLLSFEGEFASVLQVLSREGNTLSAVVRNAWDTGNLRTLTKNSPAVATGAHISIIGHITRDELLRHLRQTEAGNGFANRFLWVRVRRSKLLPEGGTPGDDALNSLVGRIKQALTFARQVAEVRRDEDARAIWHAVYPDLSDGKPGLLGAVTARGEAQVMRLALVYALLDQSSLIRAEHLRAALAVWEYSEASAEFIFGDRLGDPIADAILSAVRQDHLGMTRTEIRDLFGRNYSADRIDGALLTLANAGRVIRYKEETGGRPAERWFAVVR